jgi:hypothetical protein
MQAVTTIGLDIAKSVFQVHGVDAHGKVVVRRQLKRRYVDAEPKDAERFIRYSPMSIFLVSQGTQKSDQHCSSTNRSRCRGCASSSRPIWAPTRSGAHVERTASSYDTVVPARALPGRRPPIVRPTPPAISLRLSIMGAQPALLLARRQLSDWRFRSLDRAQSRCRGNVYVGYPTAEGDESVEAL